MPRKRPRAKIRIGRLAILSILLASFIIMGAGIGFIVGAVRNMPRYDLDNITGDLSSFIFDKDNVQVTSLRTDKNRIVLDQNEIPEVMKQALIAIEDQRFESHHGFDPIRFMGAVVANFKKGYGSQGGSTLTQQLVKIAILENPEKKLRRKIQEAIIAIKVESKYTKNQILAMYLNNVYYGHRAHSLQTAAQVYFGKDAKDLQLNEASLLAGVINAPGRYSPYLNMERAKQRQALVLNEMVKMNFISAAQAEKAKAEPFNLVGLKPYDYQYQSYVDYVIDEAATALKLEASDVSTLYTAGYRIYTGMDTEAQKTAEDVYANDKNFPAGKNDKIVQSAMVVLDPHSGEIRTVIGGRNIQGERQFNRAIDAYRQPGSAFKPVAVYGPALEKGFSPATVLDDFPQEYATPAGPKTFENYDKRYRGLISMRTAIQYSVNTAAVKMLEQIGINEGFQFAENLGITTLVDSGKANDMGLSLALGGLTKGVSPLELTAAYGVFANQGVYVKPHVIRKIEDSNGNILYQHKTSKTVVMSPQSAYLMSDMLQTVVQAGTATRAKLGDRPVAGKTGTTSFDVDAWFVGYTPDLVGSVWLGYDKVENMTGVFGGSAGAPIWSQVMKVAHKDLPPSTFNRADNIVPVAVDYKSGLLPSNLTPPEFVVTELFNSNSTPSEISDIWVQIPVCAETGELLTDFCPSPVTGTFLKRPVPWTGDIVPEDANLEVPAQYCILHGGSPGQGNTRGFSLQGSPILDNSEKLKSIKLSWYYQGENDISVFQIYRSSQPNVQITPANRVAELSVGTTSWQDNNIKDDIPYYYRLVAVHAMDQQQTISNEISIKKPEPSRALKGPHLTGEIYINGNTASVKINWTKAAENRPMIYYIFRGESPGFEPSTTNQIAVDQTITGTSFTDNNVIRKKVYYYKVLAFDMQTNEQSPVSNQLKIQIN